MRSGLNSLRLLSTIILTIVFCGCNKQPPPRVINFPETDLGSSHLIPKPLGITPSHSGFPLDEFTIISTTATKDFEEVGQFLASKIQEKTELTLPINPVETSGTITNIGIFNS